MLDGLGLLKVGIIFAKTLLLLHELGELLALETSGELTVVLQQQRTNKQEQLFDDGNRSDSSKRNA